MKTPKTTILLDKVRGFKREATLMKVSEKQIHEEEKFVVYKAYNENGILHYFAYLQYYEAGEPTHFLLGVTTEQNEFVFAQKCFVAYNKER